MTLKRKIMYSLTVSIIVFSTYTMAANYYFRAPAHGVNQSVSVGGGETPIEVPIDPVEDEIDEACYTAAVGTVGSMPGCEGMLIVDRESLEQAMYLSSYTIPHDGVDYSLADSEHNIFTGQVTNMSYLFYDTEFNEDIGYWDTSKVVNMDFMFTEAVNFNKDIGNWDTSKVVSMDFMFSDAVNFNQDIGSWDTSKVVNMDFMFGGVASFNQDLSRWCVSQIGTKPMGFDMLANSWALPKPNWGTCP